MTLRGGGVSQLWYGAGVGSSFSDAEYAAAGAELVDTHAEVFAVFGRSVERLKAMLVGGVEALPADDDCTCRHALDGLRLPFELP